MDDACIASADLNHYGAQKLFVDAVCSDSLCEAGSTAETGDVAIREGSSLSQDLRIAKVRSLQATLAPPPINSPPVSRDRSCSGREKLFRQ